MLITLLLLKVLQMVRWISVFSIATFPCFKLTSTILLFVDENIDDAQPSKKSRLILPKLLDGKYFVVLTENWSSQKNIDAQCQICGKKRRGTVRSTGNYMDHIISCHPTLIETVDQYRKQKNIVDDAAKPKSSSSLKQTSLLRPFTTQIVSQNFFNCFKFRHIYSSHFIYFHFLVSS